MRVLCILCLLVGAHAGMLGNELQNQQSANSMIAKVIQMLGEEKDKIVVNIEAETKTMAEYSQWCDDTMTETSYAIKTATNKIVELNAIITDSTAQIDSLDEDIAELGNEIAERNEEVEKADAIRAKDHDEFLKAEAEQATLIEDLQALEAQIKEQIEAIAQTPPPVGPDGQPIEPEAAPAEAEAPPEGAPAFVQVNESPLLLDNLKGASAARLERLRRAMTVTVNSIWVDPASKKNLALLKDTGFLQAPAGGAGATTHLAEAKEEQGEELEAFESLRGKAEEALQRMRDEEVQKQSEHDKNIMVLKQAIALAENSLDDAKKEHARISQEKAEATAELGETEAAKAADETTLKSVTGECTEAAAAWEKRQSEAKSETAAIDKAKEILSSNVNVFIQFKKRAPGHDLSQKTRVKLVNHFRDLGNKLHSLAMLNLVSVMSSDPMEQVKGLLTSLIAKLVKEAKDAADLHEFCTAEKEKTSAAIKKKTAKIDDLNARLETAGSKKQQLSESVADLSSEIAEMDKSQAEATKLRNEEHATFEKVSADYTQAAEAVDDAMDALKEYYGSSALVQTSTARIVKSGKAPPTLGGAKSDSAGGILSILETMGEEFRKSLKTAGAEEREAQTAYDTMVHDNEVSKASKNAEIAASQSEIKSLSVAIHNFGGDHKMASKELASINEYVAKLKPQCGGRSVPYAERKAKMDAEIQGLKDALAILEADSGTITFLQIQRH